MQSHMGQSGSVLGTGDWGWGAMVGKPAGAKVAVGEKKRDRDA